MSTVKKILIPVLKGLVAIALIYWLISTKKITAEPFIQLWQTPWLIAFNFAVVFLAIGINNYRWLLLLQGQNIKSDMKQTLNLTFIGLFFNLAMPGSVGGDVIKAYYIAQDQPATKLRAATSVLIDRIVGMYAMALIAAAAVLAHSQIIFSSPQMKPLGIFIFLLVFGFTVFFIISFSNFVRSHPWTQRFFNTVPGGKFLEKIYEAVHAFKNGKKQFIAGVILSVIVQGITIVCFYVVAQVLHFQNVSLSALGFIFPLGLIAMAIPVSPGGVGVGQAVFLTLCGWYGGFDPKVGPILITIYQVIQAVVSLWGAVLYFGRKNQNPIPQNLENV